MQLQLCFQQQRQITCYIIMYVVQSTGSMISRTTKTITTLLKQKISTKITFLTCTFYIQGPTRLQDKKCNKQCEIFFLKCLKIRFGSIENVIVYGRYKFQKNKGRKNERKSRSSCFQPIQYNNETSNQIDEKI